MAAASLLATAVAVSTMTAQARPAHNANDGLSRLATSAKTSYSNGNYVVMMAGQPAAAYTGGVEGYRATAPKGANTFNSESKAAESYTSYLNRTQDALANSVGAHPYYSYTTSFNGFAAELTSEQATL